jgi:hypothetical protein
MVPQISVSFDLYYHGAYGLGHINIDIGGSNKILSGFLCCKVPYI